jgi:hydroxymethylpyrimidine/phosphomethylpyrimidine kinase
MKTALTIAGSDSGGGAGIQADLKTFAAHSIYGTSAITAVTAQNTLGVQAWQAVPVELVVGQIRSVLRDIGADAIKTGMLANAAIVRAVAETLREMTSAPVVVDPVMIAKGGDRLLEEDAVTVLRAALLPLARVVTPNIPEAEVLAEMQIRTVEDMHAAARRILQCGPRVALVKGGHAEGPEVVDVAATTHGTFELRGPRIQTRHTHGTGCTLAAAIAANLATGLPDEAALREARRYLDGAIRNAPDIGHGQGPLNHMWLLTPGLDRG